MTNYANGANFERRIKKMYEKEGYFCVRSAGSHGPADLVCMKPIENTVNKSEILLLQMKIPKGWKDRKQELKNVALYCNVNAVYIWREDKPPFRIHRENIV